MSSRLKNLHLYYLKKKRKREERIFFLWMQIHLDSSNSILFQHCQLLVAIICIYVVLKKRIRIFSLDPAHSSLTIYYHSYELNSCVLHLKSVNVFNY